MRKLFFAQLWGGLHVVWPILSGLVIVMAGLGIIIGLLEGWRLLDSLYFAFVTGLTVGYGDLVPKRGLSRIFAVIIALSGVLLVGLVVAIGVRALERVQHDEREESGPH